MVNAPGPNPSPAATPGGLASRCRRHWPLCLVLPLALALYLFLGQACVIFDYGPDEPLHMEYVYIISKQFRLPTAEDIHLAQHGPLYYLLMAPAYRAFDPNIRPLSIALGVTRRSLLSPPDILVRRVLRALNSLMACVTLALIYCGLRWFIPDRPRLQFLALAIVAAIPTFALTSAVVNNENLAFLFAAGAFVLLAPVLARRREPTLARALGLGAWIGLGGLVKITTWYVLPLALLALVVCGQRRHKLLLPLLALGGFLLTGWAWPVHTLLRDGQLFTMYCPPTHLEDYMMNLLLADPVQGLTEFAPVAWLVPLTAVIPEWAWSTHGFLLKKLVSVLLATVVVLLAGVWAATRVVADARPEGERPRWQVNSWAWGLAVCAPLILWAAIVRQGVLWDLKLLIGGGRYLLNTAPWLCLAFAGLGERAASLAPSPRVRTVAFILLCIVLATWTGWFAWNLWAYYLRIA